MSRKRQTPAGRAAFLRCARGGAAVEFALIAAPFVGLLVAIVQTGLVFFAGQVLQASTARAARQIMTGQAQAQGATAAQFQQAVCNNAGGLFDCASLSVNVQTFSSFASISRLNPVRNGEIDPSRLSFQPGIAGNIELVQVYYPWPVGPNIFGVNLANLGGDSSLLIATSVLRNEPYSAVSA